MKNLLLIAISIITIESVNAQHLVKGQVFDSRNEALVGVNISEKGTLNGTATDLDGTFTLEVATSSAILVFSYTGFTTQEIAVEGKSSLSVTMIEGITIGVVQVVGSRSYGRTATNSAAPIDVIDVSEIASATGRGEINQIMQYAAPSFNATKQSGSDGADHIDPASLRGLGPDQTLVLVNGKRRHHSSLVNVFGTRGRGNSGTDLNAIPISAIKRIEVLRDGASAQYGSDAIAGVINVVLKDGNDGLSGGISYGTYSTKVGADYARQIFDTQDGWEPELFNIEGKNRLDGKEKSFDGNTTRLDLNYGFNLGTNGGYINFGTEYLARDRTLRPGFDYRKGYGSAAADQYQFALNAAMPLAEKTEFYLFGTKGDRDTDANAFTRGAPGADGDDRSVTSLYPDGFTPRITSKINDDAVTAGIRHELDHGWKSDFSHSYGKNNFHYFIKGTNNASLGSASPTSFDAGGHSLAMNVTSVGLSNYFETIAKGLNIAFGTEYRSENFKIFAGEEGSYANYDENGIAITNPAVQQPFVNEFGQQPTGGSQGFPGYSTANVVDQFRSNFGIYGDVELNASDQLLVGGALRYENYSDFGSTFNYKLSSRYSISENFALRASISSGFRAPSLAQIHYNLIFNNIVAGESLSTLLASNTSTVAKAFGIQSLKEEKAQNFAVGFTMKSGGFSATVDGYLINVDDRIILTDVFDATELNVGAEAAQFFANGVDTRTSGVDIVLNYKLYLDDSYAHAINFGVAGNFNRTKIENINSGSLNEFTFFGPFSQAYLEAAAPDYKFALNLGFVSHKWDASLYWTQFSDVKIQDFQWIDSPATNQAEADALYAVATDIYKAAGTLDLSLGYKFNSTIKLSFGANNILNRYPTPQFDGWTDQGGFNDSVQMGSDGAYFFARLSFNL
ncbi:MAG: TonB-dependent receptor [Saprospiraceae bacterium]|nr:TonB-dependent receptor [Saprospiraceae bacterium]